MYNVPFFNIFKRSKVNNLANYKEERMGTLAFPEKLSDANAFNLACTVTEIYWPIDFCADRVSKLRFFIADKNGKELENSEYNRFLTDINPFYSFNELFYQHVFSLMADGNSIGYLAVPSSYKNITANTITRCDILPPNKVSFDEYTNADLLNASSYNTLIARAYCELLPNNAGRIENVNHLFIGKWDASIRCNSTFLGQSPLYKAIRPINNLLAAYSARYNSYVNNGSAGLLVRKSTGKSGDGLEDAINGNPSKRQDILDDINNRNGITGRRNFWGITSQPVEFINTLASIKDLMPFEETLEDTIKIAATMQLPAGLIPRKDQPKYNNQDADEKTVWENSLTSITQSGCDHFTRMFRLDKAGVKIMADYSNVSALAFNDSAQQDIITKKLDNLVKIKALSGDVPVKDMDKIMTEIIDSYGKR